MPSPRPDTPSPRGKPRSLTGLLPFLHPYRARIGWALLCLVMAALATLAFPLALRNLIVILPPYSRTRPIRNVTPRP